MGQFKGKVAVVTGGARDIGRAISVELARQGAKVVVNYNSSRAGAKNTLEEIASFKGKAIAVKADISTSRGVKSCLLYTSPSPRDRQKSRMPSSA